jgi:predicted nucleotidyltransferase
MREVKMLNLNEKKAVAELKEELTRKYNLVEFKLFGSKARNVADKESDIDIFIVIENTDWTIEKGIYELCFEISLRYDVLLSPVIFSKKDINNHIIQATPFYQVVAREGVDI